MIERAILWVAHPPILRQRVGGMTVLERQLFTAARAGLKTLFVGAHAPAAAELAALRVPAGVELHWAEGGGAGLAECAPPYLGLSTDHLVRVETLRHVAAQNYGESISYEDAAGLGVIQVVLRRDESLSRHKQPLPEGSYRRLEAPLDGAATVDWLMESGPRPGDGFMARHFDRHISLSVSRALLETGVTPNVMTVFSTALGLAGGALFLLPGRAPAVAGALLVWLHSVLDGCDGELARVRFQESDFGADLDFWGDNLVHLVLFSCLGAGFHLAGAGPHALALSGAAVASVLASSYFAWRHRRARRAAGRSAAGVTEEVAGPGLDGRLSRLENALAQRDFIYLLVLLALVDRVYEFLWAAAVGGALYFAIMLYLRRDTNEHARQPHPARQG
ncbi:MAG: CDP-alcohol phosphatidyltransferase family protein [Elusimicrobiota bacterium]|nr:CDP-alcohol phosphatidyltransferase family protein [Elusimicrobiota bacterium]